MKTNITESAAGRTVIWIALALTALLFDMKLPRLYADLAGALWCFIWFIASEDDLPALVLHKICWLLLTVVLDIPWTVTVVAFELLYEIEEREERRKGNEDEWQNE